MTDTPRSNSSFRTGTSRQQKDTFDLALQSSAKDSKSRSSFSILPTRHNAQPLAFQTSDEPPALRRAKAAIEHGPAFSGFPTRHREQSPEEHISKPHDDDGDEEYNAEIRPWRDVHRAFLTCHGRIFGTRELRESELGETWLGIAGRRMQWTKEDETKLLARVQKSKSLRSESLVLFSIIYLLC